MKSIKSFALALSTIALLPAASFAQNISGTSIEANLKSATLGSGNVNIQDVRQSTIDLQNSGAIDANVRGTNLKVNAETTTIGNSNIDVKKAIQEALNGQQIK